MSDLIRFNNDLMTWARWGHERLDKKVQAAAESVMSYCVLHAWEKIIRVPYKLEPFVVLLEQAWRNRNEGNGEPLGDLK